MKEDMQKLANHLEREAKSLVEEVKVTKDVGRNIVRVENLECYAYAYQRSADMIRECLKEGYKYI